MKNCDYYVYIFVSKRLIIYIGITNNLLGRLWQHKHRMKSGFASTHKCNKLVYFEHFTDIWAAITREKQLKNWHRQWKLNLIKTMNPRFEDLFDKNLS